MLRYAITDGNSNNAQSLLDRARRWADTGIDFVQLREKHLETGQLLRLAESLFTIFATSNTRLLINSRLDIAAALGAGIHLTSRPGELTPAQARKVFATAGVDNPLISIACHSLPEVARAHSADLILFSPIFEKRIAPLSFHSERSEEPASRTTRLTGLGLEALATAARATPVPLLALGGITPQNTDACIAAGAAGIAGIRLFG